MLSLKLAEGRPLTHPEGLFTPDVNFYIPGKGTSRFIYACSRNGTDIVYKITMLDNGDLTITKEGTKKEVMFSEWPLLRLGDQIMQLILGSETQEEDFSSGEPTRIAFVGKLVEFILPFEKLIEKEGVPGPEYVPKPFYKALSVQASANTEFVLPPGTLVRLVSGSVLRVGEELNVVNNDAYYELKVPTKINVPLNKIFIDTSPYVPSLPMYGNFVHIFTDSVMAF